jgi:mono/diheme cytochrome c family protein
MKRLHLLMIALILVGLLNSACSGGGDSKQGSQATALPALAAQPTYPPIPTAYSNQKPPFSLTSADVIAKGKTIYGANCAPCHGANGKGDGPAAAGLNPKPIDFAGTYVKHMTPDFMFWRVNTGVPGTAMPAWQGLLSPDQIWEAIAYERTFAIK